MGIKMQKKSLRNTVLAVTAASALVLSGCSSDSDETPATAGLEPTTTTMTTSSKTTSSASSSSKTPAKPATSTQEPAPAPAPEDTQIVGVPPVDGDPAPVAPVPDSVLQQEQNTAVSESSNFVVNGPEASPEDAAAITALVEGVENETTIHGWVLYTPNHMCTRYKDAHPEWKDINEADLPPDGPIESAPGSGGTKPTIDKVENIRVNGNEASADVTATSAGQTVTEPQYFLREGEAWTFCAPA